MDNKEKFGTCVLLVMAAWVVALCAGCAILVGYVSEHTNLLPWVLGAGAFVLFGLFVYEARK